ncbi:hypothetical protein F5146DRAFT_1042950 [Armillaria mellea]|nr:hypothetical protein F5146DRAFT_1042950 [Armillaria mellea]
MCVRAQEYIRRANTPFVPPTITIAQLHAAVPPHLFRKSTTKGLAYVLQDILCAYFLYCLTPYIPLAPAVLRFPLWVVYWWCQGIVLAGWWCLAHEAGHGTISQYAWNYVPRTRSEYGLWDEREDERLGLLGDEEGLPGRRKGLDPHDVFEDAPLYVLSRMLIMQDHWMAIISLDRRHGKPAISAGNKCSSNINSFLIHFSPSSVHFKPYHRRQIITSNVGLCIVLTLLFCIGHVGRVYGVPYILANHWIVMLTYLHHSDPTMPHYRSRTWTFVRGALATVDRPLLGWVGRVFLHNVSHDHVAHHLFSSIPFYNQPEVTKIIRPLLGNVYNYDSTNTFRALYRTFTQCCFIEDDGDIVFYKNRDGKAARMLAGEEVRPLKVIV